MKKIVLYIFLICLTAIHSLAQDRSRVFDNFDIAGGVQIVTPTVTPVTTPTNAKNKKPVKKGSKSSMSVEEGLGVGKNIKSTAYSKLIMASGKSLSGFTTGNSDIDSYIVDSSIRYGIDPLLIYAQMHQESSFKLKARSYKGASGLMQLMPATARRFGVTDIYNAQQNIEGGVKYMRWLLNTFNGDVVLALAGYNAGEGAVWKYGNQIPPYRETQEYVRRITARYNSITNPTYVKAVREVTGEQAAKLEEKESAPLTIYDPGALAIKLPDGRMRLVNQ